MTNGDRIGQAFLALMIGIVVWTLSAVLLGLTGIISADILRWSALFPLGLYILSLFFPTQILDAWNKTGESIQNWLEKEIK